MKLIHATIIVSGLAAVAAALLMSSPDGIIAAAVTKILPHGVSNEFRQLAASGDYRRSSIFMTVLAAHGIDKAERTLSWAHELSPTGRLCSFDEVPQYMPSPWRHGVFIEIYPRAYRASGAIDAAEEIASYVASRICVEDRPPAVYNILEMWRIGYADRRGFELVCAASLAVVDIPVGFDPDGNLEYFARDHWRQLPDYTSLYLDVNQKVRNIPSP